MLDDDLALKLKQAGFPQDGRRGTTHAHKGQEAAYSPSLTELVLACRGDPITMAEFFARQWLAQRGVKT